MREKPLAGQRNAYRVVNRYENNKLVTNYAHSGTIFKFWAVAKRNMEMQHCLLRSTLATCTNTDKTIMIISPKLNII